MNNNKKMEKKEKNGKKDRILIWCIFTDHAISGTATIPCRTATVFRNRQKQFQQRDQDMHKHKMEIQT